MSQEQTEACTKAAIDAGITLFDTANVYGQGEAERAGARSSARYPRDSYVLATKVYFPMGPRDRGLSRAQILKQIDASLERLNTDYVDLYQCHRYDDRSPLEETMGALTEVVEAGKARFIGFSEWPADKIEAALKLPGVAKFVSSTAAVLGAVAQARGRGDPGAARRTASRRSCGRRWPRAC